ncbi:SH3 domain-containing protein [Flavobacteriales bacterium]|nr:SH3 domain-containing protein [Flavobacteriales bacterium]
MKTKIITLLALSILLFSCGPKEITYCDYQKVAEKALEKEAKHIWKEYNGEIHFLAAHVLNKSESIKLLELEGYHKEIEDYSEKRELIEKGYPVIELYFNFNGYSKRHYGANYEYSYWHNEGRYSGTVYRYWKNYDECPCDSTVSGGGGWRWENEYSTFLGLTPLFRNLLYNPDNYDTKWELKDIRDVYKDFTQEMIFEYERDTTSQYNNIDWSKWNTLNDSEFMKLITRIEDSYYSMNIKSNTPEIIQEEINLDSSIDTSRNINTTDDLKYLILQTNLNVRSQESINSTKVIMLNQYDTVQVISKGKEDIIEGHQDYWYKIVLDDNSTGYVFGYYTDLRVQKEISSGLINDPDGYTNVREGKSNKSEILYQIHEGEEFKILDNNGEWWLIEYNGDQGYIHNSRVAVIT